MNRLAPCLVAALAVGCAFTAEPDPGGVADLSDGGAQPPNLDAAPSDVFEDADALVNEPDAVEPPPADAAPEPEPEPEPEPDMYGAPDAFTFDAGPDAEPYDAGPDAEPYDAGPDAGLDGGADDGPDSGLDDPAALCAEACAELVECGPGPDLDACSQECLADDDEQPGAAARLEDCVRAHIAEARCDIAALQACMSDEPLDVDPHCILTCDALDACDLPDRPDCVDECAEAPGPERQALARCVDSHLAGDACDGFGFLVCADGDPTIADACAFLCDSRIACGPIDATLEECAADCAAEEPETREAIIGCAGLHLDRGRCDDQAFEGCLEP